MCLCKHGCYAALNSRFFPPLGICNSHTAIIAVRKSVTFKEFVYVITPILLLLILSLHVTRHSLCLDIPSIYGLSLLIHVKDNNTLNLEISMYEMIYHQKLKYNNLARTERQLSGCEGSHLDLHFIEVSMPQLTPQTLNRKHASCICLHRLQ